MKVLVVDDDLALADVISFIMQRASHQVVQAHDGYEAINLWKSENPDLIILDLNLPKLDGFAVCQSIRGSSNTPIIILTVRDKEDDIIKGLHLGADDYIVKPFSPRQMTARVEAVFRRASRRTTNNNILQAGDLALDLSRKQVQCGQHPPTTLTQLESRLLDILMRNCGQIVPSDMIIDYVWGPAAADRSMLKQLVYRLRRKIEPDPSKPTYLETRSNIGYILSI